MSSHSEEPKAGLDSGLECLLVVARLHGVAADGAQVRHAFGEAGKPLGEGELVRAARRLGFKARAVDSAWERLAGLALPAFAQRRDGRVMTPRGPGARFPPVRGRCAEVSRTRRRAARCPGGRAAPPPSGGALMRCRDDDASGRGVAAQAAEGDPHGKR